MRVCGSAQICRSAFSFILATPCASLRYISLSELAKAFTEMSEVNAETGPAKTMCSEGTQRRMSVVANGSSLPQDANVLSSTGGTRGVVTFSKAYSKKLGEMSGPQFAMLLEVECKQQHYGHMLQCLVEVWRRLSKVPPVEVGISDQEARGELATGASSSSSCLWRTDELLEYVLRVLAKTNIDGVQLGTSFAEELNGGGIKSDWVTELSSLLLQWLTARAASVSASRSATLLHFLGQQKAFHCDAVLETLRDNIEVCLANSHNYAFREGTATRRVDNSFGLGAFAMVLDAMSRWQLDFIRLVSSEKKVTHSGTLSTALWTTDAITNHKHPILNASFYNAVVSGLLRGVRDGSIHLTHNGSPSTFFFLTLALAKIRWFHVDCAEVLLPQLHKALGVFPGQFLSVLLLLGRREVKVCQCETTDLLLHTLLNAMQKRGQRYAAVDGRRRNWPESSELVADDMSISSGSLTANGVGDVDNVATSSLSLVDVDSNGDSDFELFSLFCPGPATRANGVCETGGGSQSPAPVFTTSFIDLCSVPVFLDSLNHIMTVTLDYCSAHAKDAQRRALSAKAESLYEALLNDTHSGIKSLNALLERPALVEKVLLSVLRIPSGALHPLVIELAYVFTRHVGTRGSAGNNKNIGGGGGNVSAAAAAAAHRWRARVLCIVEHLVRRGVLTSDLFVMRDEVISLAPRVAAEIESEKKRLLEKYLRREEQEKKCETKKKKTVRTAAVFARFSRTVLQMTQ